MGKRKSRTKEKAVYLHYPEGNDMLGIATKVLGNARFMVKCADGKERLCRVRGKMKKRVWVKLGDVVLVSPWDFQSDERGDIIWRYRRNQVEALRRKGYRVPVLPSIKESVKEPWDYWK